MAVTRRASYGYRTRLTGRLVRRLSNFTHVADAPSVDLRGDAFMTNPEPSDEFCFYMEHRRVEKSEDVHSADHLGPFLTEDAAGHALETVAKREKAYGADDSE